MLRIPRLICVSSGLGCATVYSRASHTAAGRPACLPLSCQHRNGSPREMGAGPYLQISKGSGMCPARLPTGRGDNRTL